MTKPTKPTAMKSAAANDTDQAAIDAAAAKPRSEAIAAKLFEFQSRHGFSDERLGRMLGSSATYISRYRSNDFKGDLAKFESTAEAVMLRHELMQGDDSEISPAGFCVESVHGFLDLIQQQRQIGVGYGPAGRGKTKASQLYAYQRPGTIYIHLWDWTARKDLLIAELSRAAGVRRAKSDATPTHALVRSLRDSDRLLILDNAHELHPSGRRWLADFHDSTKLPIALVGNPQIVAQWESNDQHASRLGRCVDITEITDTKSTVLHLLRSYLPAAAADRPSQGLALEILRKQKGGAARALKMHLRLAARILGGSPATPPAEALRLASTQLIHAA